jgi:UDP-hydrolysing UDP-N-acetyl-D-glucosamine 2-epimerase
VTVSGAPALDQVRSVAVMSRAELEARVGMPLDEPPLLVTFHPVTLDPGGAAGQIAELLAAIRASGYPAVMTYPNVDAEHDAILIALRAYVDSAPRARLVANLGTRGYFSLMAHAAAMVGNSSSGIIEAASFGLPVVNVGDRQAGRFHGQNVLDVPCERAAIEQAIRTAAAPQFRARFAGASNPYGDGHASERIAGVLRSTPLDRRLLAKRFADIEACS